MSPQFSSHILFTLPKESLLTTHPSHFHVFFFFFNPLSLIRLLVCS